VRDSCGSSGTGETHAGVYAEEAHRPPAESEQLSLQSTTSHYLVNSNKVCENSLYFKSIIREVICSGKYS
jgi:hypothetical protein